MLSAFEISDTLNVADKAETVEKPVKNPAVTSNTFDKSETVKKPVKNPAVTSNTADKSAKDNKTTAKVKKAKPKNPQKRKAKYTKLGKIYAYKPSGDCLEFEDLYIASEKLNTDIEELFKIIKNNSDRLGLVFTSDSDY